MSCKLVVLASLVGAGFPGAAQAGSPPPATLVLTNANVHTLAEKSPQAQALCIDGDRITFVGKSQEASQCGGGKARTIDLRGATVVPGWTDAHYHLSGVGWREMRLNLEGTPGAAAMAQAVRERVAKAQPGEWIVGRGWIETHWKPAVFPTRALLDPLSPKNPVILERADGHASLVNSAALELAGIDASTRDPAGGRILRDDKGEPTGMLIDRAVDLVTVRMPKPTGEQERQALKLAGERSLSLGLTMIQDAGRTGEGEYADYEEIDRLRALYRDGSYRLRVYKSVVGPGAGAEKLVREGALHEANGRLTVRTIKLQMDGALGSRGAALLEPYSDEPATRGLFRIDDAALEPLLAAALRSGIQVEAHAIGDHANRHTLDLFQAAFEAVPPAQRKVADPRWRIEHAQVVNPADRIRFRELGVIPSMQPSHAISDLYFAPARLGPKRLEGAYSWRSFVELGLPIAGGSDAPVERGEPMIEYYAAVARKDLRGRSGEGWHPEQAVSRLDALRMFTIWPAYAAFQEKERGSIEPGKVADLTVLSADILTIPAQQILETRALMTIVGGEVVYRAP
jgi:predicted amidohydrolase YtcJ